MNKRLQTIAWCVFAAGVVIGCKGGDEADKKAKAEQLKACLREKSHPLRAMLVRVRESTLGRV